MGSPWSTSGGWHAQGPLLLIALAAMVLGLIGAVELAGARGERPAVIEEVVAEPTAVVPVEIEAAPAQAAVDPPPTPSPSVMPVPEIPQPPEFVEDPEANEPPDPVDEHHDVPLDPPDSEIWD